MEKAPAKYTIQQFMDITEIGGSSFSPDETKLLINSKASGIYNAYEVDIESGEQTQVTYSEDNAIFAHSYFPDDNRFIFSSDQRGNEISHIFIKELNGNVKDIIDDSSAKAVFWGWSKDRSKFYYGSNSRDQRFFDMYQIKVYPNNPDGNLYNSTLVYKNEEGLNPSGISHNGRYLILSETITRENNNMYLLDTETGEKKLLSPHEGNILFNAQYFSKDDTRLFYLTDENNEFKYLKSYNLETGATTDQLKEDWDIAYAYQSKNGKYRVIAINKDAQTEIKIFDKNTGKVLKLPDLPEGNITSVNISTSENLMSFYASSSRSPQNLYLYNFETQKVKQLTNTMSPEINPEDLVAGEVIRYKSFDGMEIPAILYKPKGLEANEKIPAMLMIHGGPGGQSRLNYTARIQYFVNHGYAILAVNNRGSSGYGKTFFAADKRKHGIDDLQDCIESKKYLASLEYIDTDKIGIMGGSYGGYMVMAALAFKPEAFKVGVNYFGVTNWIRTLKSIPPWWTSMKDALYDKMGDPVADADMLYNKSPLFHAKKITKPFIVLQGANDPRVLKVESDEIVAEAKNNNVTVEYVIFDDEGHGFTKKENNIAASKAVLNFLNKYLKGEEEAQAS